MSASSTSSQIDCSLMPLARDFNKEMNICLANNPFVNAVDGGASCVTIAAIEALQNMHSRCVAKPGPKNCTPYGYVDAVIEEVDAKNRILKIGFGKVNDKAMAAAGIPTEETIKTFLVGAGGCLIGGAAGAIGGARATPRLPLLGASFGAVVGCRRGIVLAEAGYGLWNVVVKAGDTYDVIEKTFDTLKRHDAACGIKPIPASSTAVQATTRPAFNDRIFFTKIAGKSLAELPQSPFTRSASTTSSQQILEYRPLESISRAITPIKQLIPLPPSFSSGSSQTLISSASFSWIEMEDAAQKILDVAADLTGVTGAVAQTKELKQLFVTILSDPENAPKLLFQQVMKEPERILQKIVTTPKEFMANGKAFMDDPTLMGALNTVGTIYTIISLANDLLPVLEKITSTALRDPLATPVVLTKEMSKLLVGKILGVVKLAEALLNNPVKAIEHLYKGIVKSPEMLCKNVKNLMGGGRKKHKRRKRHARQLEQYRLQAEQSLRAETTLIKDEIITVFPSCYTTAKHQWMIPETKTPETYFSELIADWKDAVHQKRFQGNCAEFIRTVHSQLIAGHFSMTSRLSPKAHSAEMTVPAIVAYAIIGVAKSTLELACEIKSLERIIEEHKQSALRYGKTIESYTGSLQASESLTAGQSAQLMGEDLANSKTKALALALLD